MTDIFDVFISKNSPTKTCSLFARATVTSMTVDTVSCAFTGKCLAWQLLAIASY